MGILVMWLVFMYFTGTVQQGSAACISSVFYRNCTTWVSSPYIFCILQELYNKGQQPVYLLYFTGTVQQGSAACISSVFYRNCTTRVSSPYIFCILQEQYNKCQQPVYLLYFTGTVQQGSAACISSVFYRNCTTRVSSPYIFCILQELYNKGQQPVYLLYFTGTVQQGSAACIYLLYFTGTVQQGSAARISSVFYRNCTTRVSSLYIFCILQELYNKGQQPVYLLEHEPSIVASLLKQYLRELPEPVLTTELMPKFEQASSKSKSCIKCACLRECARPNPCRKIKMAIYKSSDWVSGLIWR